MNAERVEAVLALLGAIRGGDAPRADQVELAQQATPDERSAAESLFAEGILAEGPRMRRRLAVLEYLAVHAPSLTVGEALESLEGDQLAQLMALTEAEGDHTDDAS